MKAKFFLLPLFLLQISSVAQSSDRLAVKTEKSFMQIVDGRTLSRVGIRLQVLKSGYLKGASFGDPLEGQWYWEKSRFCRSLYFVGDKPRPFVCESVSYSKSVLTLTDKKGNQSTFRVR